MAETDIELSVGLTAGDAKKAAQDLGKSIKDIFEKSAGTTLDSKFQKMQQQMAQTTSKATTLMEKMSKLESVHLPTQEYKEIQKEIDKTTAQIAKLQEKWDKAQEIGKPLQGSALRAFQYDAAQLENTLEYLKGEMQDLISKGRAFTLGTDSAEYTKLVNDLANVNNQSRVLINRWEQQTQTANKTSKSVDTLSRSTKRYAQEAKKASGISFDFNKSLKKGIWTVLKYGFGIRSMYFLFRKLRAAALEGIQAFVKWEGENGQLNKSISMMSSSLATLKNNIGAMIVPIINALAPAITRIIDLISVAIQKISMFIALLSGNKTIMVADKVQKNYAASLDKTGKSAKKAAKELKGYLSPLDEINQYQSQKDNDDAGAGAGGGVDTGSFREVPVDPKLLQWFEDLKNKIDELKNKLKPFWDAFKEGFKKGLGDDWKDKVDRIKEALNSIKDTLKEIWTDPEVSAARERYFLSLAEMLGALVGTAARIGLNIGVNLTEGIAQALEAKKDEIKDYLVEMFDIGTELNQQIEEFALAIGEISDVLTGENAVAATQHFVEIFLEAFMLVTENAARLGLAIVELVTQPIIDNKDKIKRNIDEMFSILSEWFDFIQSAIKDVRDILTQVWNDKLNPMFDSLKRALSDLLGIILDAWYKYVAPILHEIGDAVKELWDTYLKPVADDFINIIGTIGHLIALLFENIVVPYIKKVIEVLGPKLRDAISIIISVVKLAAEVVMTVIGWVTGILRSLLEFVEIGFTQGWDKAWEHLKESFGKVWDGMLEKLKGILNTMLEIVEKTINLFVHAINSISGKLSGALSDIEIPEWLGGGTINVNIPELSDVHIPRLAQGAVIPPNKEFLALLGDQKSGTNIETPLATMVEAFKQAMREGGTNGNGVGRVVIQLVTPDKQRLAEYVVEGGKVIQMSTGNNIFELVQG